MTEKKHSTLSLMMVFFIFFIVIQTPMVNAQSDADFTVTIAPTRGNVVQGDGTTATILVSTTGEWDENEHITLSATGLPRGAYIGFTPENLYPNKNQFSSTMTIGTSTGTPVGSYEVAINGTLENTGKVRSVLYTLSVGESPKFVVNIFPPEANVIKGKSTNAILKVSGEYSGTIHLYMGGIPSGIDVSFTPSAGTPPFDSILTIRVLESVVSGDYPLVITAKNEDTTRTTVYTVRVKVGEESVGTEILDRILLGVIAIFLIVAATFVAKK